MKQVHVNYDDYSTKLKEITSLLSDNNEAYVIGKTDKIQLDILVRLVVDKYVKDNVLTEPVELVIRGLLAIKLNMFKLNDVTKYAYAYKIK